MPQLTIPLAGAYNRRLFTSAVVDARFVDGIFSDYIDSATNTKQICFQKRGGYIAHSTPAAGSAGVLLFNSPSTGSVVSAFGTTIYYNATSCSTGDSLTFLHVTEAVFNGITYILLTTSTSLGYYLASDAVSGFTFTGDTHTNTTIDNISSMTGLYVGQLISGTGIQASTRIATKNVAGSSITTTIATTGTASITVTRTGIAKIIDANFPDASTAALRIKGSFVELDGYVFIMTLGGRIYQSSLNDPATWSASNYITANRSTDTGIGLAKHKDKIFAFGTNSCEILVNAGNPTGSVLSAQDSFDVGAYTSGNSSASLIATGRGYIAWVSANADLYLFDGSAKKISTPGIQQAAFAVDIFTYGTLDIISFSTASATYWYLVDYKRWVELSFTTISRFSSAGPSTFELGTFAILGDTSGKVYRLMSSAFQDNGSAFTMTIQTENKVLNGGKGFIIHRVDLIADTQASGTTTLATSKDDYATFQTHGQTFDMTANTKYVSRLGKFNRQCAFRLTHSANTAWRGQAIVVDWSPAG